MTFDITTIKNISEEQHNYPNCCFEKNEEKDSEVLLHDFRLPYQLLATRTQAEWSTVAHQIGIWKTVNRILIIFVINVINTLMLFFHNKTVIIITFLL